MKILLVDDHTIVRAGLRRLLEALPQAIISEAATGEAALRQVRGERPDLVILDLNLPDLGGVELLRKMRSHDDSLRVLVLSMHAAPVYARRAMEAGARGYVSKNAPPDELLGAVRAVAEGGRYIENDIAQAMALQDSSADGPLQRLSGRDLEIMRLLAAGKSLGEIAEALGVGYKTVANTCSLIKTKLGVSRTTDLVRMAIEGGLS
jgi:two-component system invasion response regulator UvrY